MSIKSYILMFLVTILGGFVGIAIAILVGKIAGK